MGPPLSTAAPAEWIAARRIRRRFGVQVERLLWLVVTGKVRHRITPDRPWPEYSVSDIERALSSLPKIGNYRDRRRAPPGPSEVNETDCVALAAKQTPHSRPQNQNGPIRG